MNEPLTRLRELMGLTRGEEETIEFHSSLEIDQVLKTLERRAKRGSSEIVPLDLQTEAVRRFWQTKELSTVQEARRVSFGLSLPIAQGDVCILEDSERFQALLSSVDRWAEDPRRFRRCFQGLVTNYFSYDVFRIETRESGKDNWISLRDYLLDRSHNISAGAFNPDWVTCAIANPQLFSAAPCDVFAEEMLRGQNERAELVRTTMGIDSSSWFTRELLTVQIGAAIRKNDSGYIELLPHLLEVLEQNPVLRDQSMVQLLDRYARSEAVGLHAGLRDAAVKWWGNPWLPSNSMRWGGVTVAARSMVTDWLKLEFIEAFFTLLAEEGTGDRRRLDFWKRYINSIDRIQFVLGHDARTSGSNDFVALREKMTGLVTELRDSDTSNNAFVMTMGDLVVVEFSGQANALYGYDRRRELPFDLSRPVVSSKNSRNSLKSARRSIWMRHADGIHGFATWEDMFEAKLTDENGIVPAVPGRRRRASASRSQTANGGAKFMVRADPDVLSPNEALSLPYSRGNLEKYAKSNQLTIDDKKSVGGNLWVPSSVWNVLHDGVLSHWGFTFKQGKGWWK